MQAEAEAAEMQMKGFTYQQQTAREVGLEAMQNGLGGDGAAGALGDVAGLGLTLGALGGVVGMTREAMEPLFQQPAAPAVPAGRPASAAGGWDCACGEKGIASKFCPNCGAKRPEKPAAWDCACGERGITSKFCPNCGRKREG